MNSELIESASAESLVAVLHHWARERASDTAYIFLRAGQETSRLTFASLLEKSSLIARNIGRREREPVVVVCSELEDTVCNLFGAWLAGAIAVPVCAPRSRRTRAQLSAIASDCGARLALVSHDYAERVRVLLGGDVRCVAAGGASAVAPLPADVVSALPRPSPSALALLQYTSGSTGAPKGVMLTHRNLVENERVMRQALGTGQHTVLVGWLPLHHDMGLIGNVLHPFSLGRPSILLSPLEVVQQPLRWLEAITRYRATTSGGPASAFSWCIERIPREARAQLDLSSWTNAVVGAEPVPPEVLDRFADEFAPQGFRAESFYPCYGLAEATLLVAGGDPGRARKRVDVDGRTRLSMGRAHGDAQLCIVDPEHHTLCADGELGEVWLASSCVGQGYWRRDVETARVFGARIANADGTFLRTGDLGFIRDGELYIHGRLKDVVIVRGAKYAAEDIEHAASRAHPALHNRAAAAFAVDGVNRERVVVACELDSASAAHANAADIEVAVRCALIAELELAVDDVTFVQPASLPRTTSGKIRRGACRDAWLEGRLRVRSSSRDASRAGASSEVAR